MELRDYDEMPEQVNLDTLCDLASLLSLFMFLVHHAKHYAKVCHNLPVKIARNCLNFLRSPRANVRNGQTVDFHKTTLVLKPQQPILLKLYAHKGDWSGRA